MENMDNSYKLAPSPPSSPPLGRGNIGERKLWNSGQRVTHIFHIPLIDSIRGTKKYIHQHAVIHTINNMMMTIFLTLIFQKPCRIGGGRENHRKRLIFNGLAENW